MVAYPIAQALLNAGARIDIQDREGRTPVAHTRSVNVYQTGDERPRFERDWHLKMYFCWVELLQSLEKFLVQHHWLVFEEDGRKETISIEQLENVPNPIETKYLTYSKDQRDVRVWDVLACLTEVDLCFPSPNQIAGTDFSHLTEAMEIEKPVIKTYGFAFS